MDLAKRNVRYYVKLVMQRNVTMRRSLRRPYEGFAKVLTKEMRRSLRRGCEGPCESFAKVLAKALRKLQSGSSFTKEMRRSLRKPYFKKAPFT